MSVDAEHPAPDVLTTPEAGGLVIRGSVMRIAGFAVGTVLLAAASVLLLRHLGVVAFGQYVTVMSVVTVASVVADAGLSAVGSRELALRAPGPERRALLANMLGIRMLITPLGVVGAVVFSLLAGYPKEMVIGTLLAGAGLTLTVWQGTLLLLPVVELKNGRVTAVEVTKQVVTVIGIAALVAAGAALTPFFAVPIALGVILIVTTPLLLGRGTLVLPRRNLELWRTLLRESLPVAAAFVLVTLYLRIVVVLMSLISSGYETGLFSTSFRILETLIQAPMLLAGIALPLLTAAARDDHERLRNALQRITQVGLTCAALAVVVTVLAADTIVTVLGGEEYEAAGIVLQIQVCALFGIFLSQFWNSALIALHQQRDLIVVNAIALVGLGVLAGVLIPLWGAKGGALATVLGDLLLAGLLLWRLRTAGTPGELRFGFLWRLLAITAVALAPGLIPGLWEPAAAALGFALFIGAAIVLKMVPEELPAALRARRHG
ncbi:polysaccharide biosynthesis C-terminal domain-containing protein [Solirubrobacter phytolaccae]|uniref:Polysaccharide biosynthesis C-terminal domain-containing protein n=1 Tax=Solirubrobacter phytolaccae TaxID=1404360 RepID=A0A9X3SB35_9ACTN|nr:polysaccharide biosynthesis C-terminal domain-containing protein [Solirubrobacter phytolaccae]MDA0185149.1 polysaccharide biosynthesis C-terminal domain-containing protein [Solirubrobacter phytolaccae]